MTTATARTRSLKINTGPIVTTFNCPILFALEFSDLVALKKKLPNTSFVPLFASN